MEAHQALVERVAAQTLQFYERQTPYHVYHGSTNSTRKSKLQRDNTVDTSNLNGILHVDTARKVAVVEPNVPMDALIRATLRHSLVPLVVMEFPGITVGGGFSGTSGESSSFRHGTFESTINSIEIVTPDGQIRHASKTEQPDLFWGAASAFGTLGVVTMLEVQLRDAASYVELTYHLCSSLTGTSTFFHREFSNDDTDYLDAITFSKDSTLVCRGRLVDALPEKARPQRFQRARDPWFYLHAQRVEKRLKKQKSGTTETDFIPIEDYLFRYNRGAFWVARYAFRYFLTPFNAITRFIVDPFMQTRVLFRAMHKSGLTDYAVVQDVAIPFDKLDEFDEWIQQSLDIYPRWLCPLYVRRDSPDSGHGLCSKAADPNTPAYVLNFGIWAPVGIWAPQSFNRDKAIDKNRELEAKVQELGGDKCLYAHAYYTEDEFWASYDRASYDALRTKYNAGYLPSVFQKVCIDVEAERAALRSSRGARWKACFWGIWPLRGFYGLCKAVVGGDYLLQKPPAKVIQSGKSQ